MDENVLPSKLFNRLSSAAEIVRSHGFIQVFSHHDADGISAAGIIAKTLSRADKEYAVTLFTTMNDEYFEIVKECGADCILMTDLGASYIRQLEKMDKKIIVLDHHSTPDDSETICYANPHLVGIDGMTSGCGATMAFLFSLFMNEENWDLVQIAFAGIAGDRQHINGLSGLNTYLLDEGVRRGLVKVTEGSLVPPGPMSKALYLTTDPYIRGVTGNQEGVSQILKDAGVSLDESFTDLTDDEKRRLSTLIAIKLTRQGVTLQTMKEVARTRYFLKDWGMDAESFADILNACGRSGVGGIGVSVCLGSDNDLVRAAELNNESKNKIVTSITDLDNKGLTQMEHLQHFDSTSSGFTGILCGIAMQFIGDPDKPTIGINSSDGKAKVSSRGMWQQLDKGIDLSSAMRLAADSVGGTGGGHKIASGASFEAGCEETFLANLDNILKEQLSSAK
ncbi:MAG: DHH family phosphoesterase [Candidatus Methanomethylophilaceae archaeon]